MLRGLGEPQLPLRGVILRGVCLVYGKAPARQLHGIPIAVSGSGHTRKRMNSFGAVIRYAGK